MTETNRIVPTDKLFMYHLDLKRPQWTPGYLEQTVDRLRGWGFNSILYEIEDKFQFTRHPAIAHAEAPSHEATAAFVGTCRAKGLEVIPMMQSLGHAECVVGKPAYAHLRETPDCIDQYDPLSEQARQLICSLYDEIITVMQPREFFHLGGDETFSLGVGAKSRPVVKEVGIGGLYLRHMLPIIEHVRKRGLRPIIWADIVLSHPEIIAQIPRDVVLMDWDYGVIAERGPGLHIHGGGPLNPRTGHRATIWGLTFADYARYDNPTFRRYFDRFAVDDQTRTDGSFRQFYATDALLAAGLEVITASANRSCGDMMGIPQHAVHLPNCFHSARKGVHSGLGHLVTSWAVRHNHPEVGYPATFAAVFALAHDEPFCADAICDAFARDFYGHAMPDLARAMTKAQEGFWGGESRNLLDAQQRLCRGENPLPGMLEQLQQRLGTPRAAAEHMQAVREGYVEARDLFGQMEVESENERAQSRFLAGRGRAPDSLRRFHARRTVRRATAECRRPSRPSREAADQHASALRRKLSATGRRERARAAVRIRYPLPEHDVQRLADVAPRWCSDFRTTHIPNRSCGVCRGPDFLSDELANAGVIVLRNTSRAFFAGESVLQFVGVEDYWSPGYDPRSAFELVDPDSPAITLAHNPDAAPQLAAMGAEWILAGHTHGKATPDTRFWDAVYPATVVVTWTWRAWRARSRLRQGLVPAGPLVLPQGQPLGCEAALARYSRRPQRFDRASAIRLLVDGREAFPEMLMAIDAAVRTLDLETYILADDRTGRLFRDALCRAAQRGVHVRLLYDYIGSWSLDGGFPAD